MNNKNKTIKEEQLLDKGLLNTLWMSVIIILVVIYFVEGSESDFTNLIKIICAILASLTGTIIHYKIPNIKNDFIKYIGIGFLYLGTFDFIEIFYNTKNIPGTIDFALRSSIGTFESIIILCSLVLYRKKIDFFISNLIFLGNIIIITIVAMFITSINTIEYLNSKYIYVNIIGNIILAIITLKTMLKYKNIIGEKETGWLVEISLLFFFYHIMELLGIVLYVNMNYEQSIYRLIAYGVAYRYVEEKLFDNSYRDSLNKLMSIQKTSKSRNNSLMRKERSLMESRINLKKSEERYENIIDNIRNAILIFKNNRLMYTNKNGRKYIVNELNRELNEVHLDYILKLLSKKEIDIEDRNKGFIKEFIINNRENKNINIMVTLKNISPIEKVLLIRNITDSNELQKLREKRDKAKIMETSKDEFYSNISHELRTPINIVNSALQLNNLMLQNNRFDDMIKNNNIIRQNCLRLIRTTNNFIDSNRISEGFLECHKNVYNIVSIIETVVLACNKYMILMDNRLTFDTDLEVIYLVCDKAHIERIMLNILSNSLKYGKIAGNIDVRIESSLNEVRIFVINDAPAIPEEKKNVIFEKFTKLDSSLTRPSEGSGLGLYITKELVALNGGTIEITSNAECGNIFDIRFPFKFEGEPSGLKMDENEQNLQGKVNIEFSDIYFN